MQASDYINWWEENKETGLAELKDSFYWLPVDAVYKAIGVN